MKMITKFFFFIDVNLIKHIKHNYIFNSLLVIFIQTCRATYKKNNNNNNEKKKKNVYIALLLKISSRIMIINNNNASNAVKKNKHASFTNAVLYVHAAHRRKTQYTELGWKFKEESPVDHKERSAKQQSPSTALVNFPKDISELPLVNVKLSTINLFSIGQIIFVHNT